MSPLRQVCLASALLLCGLLAIGLGSRGATISTIPAVGFSITGSITHAGRTVTPTTAQLGLITAGGSQSKVVAVSDPISGDAQVGDACEVGLTAALPAGMMAPYCIITVNGSATVYFPASLAITTSTISYYVMWRG